jgi:hypothetical protein
MGEKLGNDETVREQVVCDEYLDVNERKKRQVGTNDRRRKQVQKVVC